MREIDVYCTEFGCSVFGWLALLLLPLAAQGSLVHDYGDCLTTRKVVEIAILIVIVLGSFLIGAAIGFGNSVIMMTLAIELYPLDTLVPIAITLNLTLYAYLTIRHRTGIDKSLLLRKILPLTLIGLPIGLLIFNLADATKLKWWFGLFVVCLSVFEIVNVLRSGKATPVRPMSWQQTFFWLIGGGVTQGLWVSGGPFIAYWTARNIPEKRVFRSTLSVVWLLLNAILLVSHLIAGRFTWETTRMSAILLPFVALGIFLGEKLHHRLPEKAFRLIVFVVLALVGAAIVWRG